MRAAGAQQLSCHEQPKGDIMIQLTATSGELAQAIGVTERVVAGRRQDGRLPTTEDGRIDLHAVLRAGVAALAVKQSSDGRPDLKAEKARLASEQADQVAMRNATMRGEMVPIAEITQAVVGMIEVTKRHLARVPVKAFPTDHPNRKRVADAIEAALIDLSAERAKLR